jgi:outer membrane immunogenic protein
MKSATITVATLACAAGLGAAGLAQAQPATEYDWSGVHVGANLGWRWNSVDIDPSNVTVNQLSGVNNGTGTIGVPPTGFTAAGADLHHSNFTWGGQAGFDKQFGMWVLGVEGDLDANYGHENQVGGLYALGPTDLTAGSTVSVFRSVQPRWSASLRGRVGAAFGRFLLYGTGGLAWANMRENATFVYSPMVTDAVAFANPGVAFGPYASSSSRSLTQSGWTAGGGAEFAVSHNVSVALEYRHSDYGHATFFDGAGGPNGVIAGTRLGYTDDALLGKVNFRFGGY